MLRHGLYNFVMTAANFGKDYNEFYRIHTPQVTPLPFGGFYRLAAKADCVKCGRDFIQVLRIHKVHLGAFTTDQVLVKPIPSDEKIMTSFMLRVCENGVGCWKNCRPHKHLKVCQLPSKRLILGHDPHRCPCPQSAECTCPTGCGNRGIFPCECGHAFGSRGKHMDGCPTGLYKRRSSFSIEHLRSQLLAGRPR